MYVLVTNAMRSVPAELASIPMVTKVRSLAQRDRTKELKKLEMTTRLPEALP